MNRVITTILLFSGMLFLICGFLLQNTLMVQAQDDDDREYIGIRECNDCHRDISNRHELTRHGMTLLEVEEDSEPEDLGFVLGNFGLGEDIRTVIFPDGTERAFNLDDIAFTLGTGSNYQAYVTALDNDSYAVLPALWDSNTMMWVPLRLADTWLDSAYDFGSQCAGCHTVGLSFNSDTEIYEWEEEGVQCEACHGPGSLHAELVEDFGFEITGTQYLEIFAALDNPTDARVCGACHIRGRADDGIHPYPIEYIPGNELLTAFSPVPTDDASHWYTDGYAAHPNMQYNEWLHSGHASSLNTVLDSSAGETACLMCHSGIYSVAQRVLIAEDMSDPTAFAIAPLILRVLEQSGLSPSQQQMMLERWLPLVLSAIQAEDLLDTPLEDVLFPLFDLLDIDEDDYDPQAPLLAQFMPQLAEFIIDAEKEALKDNDTENLDRVNALMEQLVPLLVDDILSQAVSIDEALPVEMASQPDNFGVTCAACHLPHIDETEAAADITIYALCTSCHQGTTLTETLHHPVREMFEGQTIIESVAGIPSTHFAETDGPRCSTCHMSDILLSDQSIRINHTWNPVLPNSDPDSPPDACSGCHTDLSTDDLRSLIEDTQDSVQSRLSFAWARVGSIEVPTSDAEASHSYEQAVQALLFVQNDGSRGVHNYAYTDALLNSASNLLSQLSVPGSDLEPTEAPMPTATASAADIVISHEVLPSTSGMRPITLIILVGTGLLLMISAWGIFRRSRHTTTSEGDM